MNQLAQLLVLVFIISSMHLSASSVQKVDTIGNFNEVTDIEKRLKNLMDTTERVNNNQEVFEDSQRVIQEDSLRITQGDSLIVIQRDSLNQNVADSLLQKSIARDSTLAPLHKDSLLLPISADSVIIDKSIITQSKKKEPGFVPPVITTSLDSIYSRKSNGIINLPQESYMGLDSYINRLTFRDTMFFNPLFLPVVFTGRIEHPDSILVNPLEVNNAKKQIEGILTSQDNIFEKKLEDQRFIDRVKRDYFINNIDKINISATKLKNIKQAASDQDVRERFNPFRELLSSQSNFSLENPEVEATKISRVYWVKTGQHSLQISQNYFSPNWHRGGTSNFNINSDQVFNVNYQKNKVRFNNRLEWRLAIFNAPNDTLRDFRIGNDMLRYYGDFGFDAYKRTWSYSTNLEVKTQIFKSHQSNKKDVRSAFLSPLYVNAGIGMKYNLDNRSKSVRHRRIRLAVSISPLSVNYRYVGSDEVNQKRYGIPEDKSSILDKGSTVTANMTYNLNKYMTWSSRFKYFTNYSKVEAELENTLNMSLSRYFSTKLYLHLRYDDGVPSHEDYKYLQINEVVSFGLNFNW